MSANAAASGRHAVIFLRGATLLLAASGLIYELVIGTMASYVHGDTTRQFAMSFGLFTAGLGAGAGASRWVSCRPWWLLAWVELALCVYGIFLVPVCMPHGFPGAWVIARFGVASVIGGILVGLELPVIAGLLGDFGGTMALDYAGALVASWLFPFAAMPLLGLDGTAAMAGGVNALAAFGCMWFAHNARRDEP